CLGKGPTTACIQYQRSTLLSSFFKSFWAQSCISFLQHILEALISEAIHGNVHAKISRRSAKTFRYCLDKTFLIRLVQRVIATLLIAQDIYSCFLHVFTTGAARSVCWIYNHIVGQGQYFLVKAVIKHSGELLLSHISSLLCQIRTAHIA